MKKTIIKVLPTRLYLEYRNRDFKRANKRGFNNKEKMRAVINDKGYSYKPFDDKKAIFIHVPKCAGASVEHYLRARFGNLAFVNSKFYRREDSFRWTKTSPQHVDAEAIALLFPKDWIKSSFAVVRHPIARLRSAFDYQRRGEKTISEDMDINLWIQQWADSCQTDPYQFDHHLRPACDLIVANSTIFRMEDNLDDIVAHLDKLEGKTAGSRQIPHENKRRSETGQSPVKTPLTPDSLDLIAALYAEDFKKFGYDCREPVRANPVSSGEPKKLPYLTRFLGR